jgi:hypothetical protein
MPSVGRRKCLGGCGRWLTDPESQARGYGRICAERHGIPVDRPATTRRPTIRTTDSSTSQIEGQAELSLTDHQPTLWSL